MKQPITMSADHQMNQSDFRENTCRLSQSPEKTCGQILCPRLQAVVLKKISQISASKSP